MDLTLYESGVLLVQMAAVFGVVGLLCLMLARVMQ
jgi:hypothetical protein